MTPEKMKEIIPNVDVPEGQFGHWKIERFEISQSEVEFEMLRAAINPGRGYRVPEVGTYTKLTRGGALIMSDTPAEKSDHYEMVRRASGDVLIFGLGIGMVLNACLLKPEVTHATVIEIDPDVIRLVGPHYVKKFPDRVSIVLKDANEYKPVNGQRWNAVWIDIWESICGDNLKQMAKLKSRFKRRSDWVGCWCEPECRASLRGWR